MTEGKTGGKTGGETGGKTGATIVGIDLGTTFSLVSIMRDDGPVVLPNALGSKLTASAVSLLDGGEVVVGAAARARATTHPERTALVWKRDMGTDRRWQVGDRSFTPPELSALVLRSLKADAEAALGQPVEEAVVTVPAYFDEAQRRATRDAGAIAGLRVDRIINEPTAAALAYGLHERHRERRAVVLDLGGGTFDVTVLEIIEGVIEIQASAGDSRLGGEDFAEALAVGVAGRLGLPPEALRAEPRSWARLLAASDEAKRALSTEASARIALPDLAVDGRPRSVDLTVTRAEAEALWAPLLDRMRAPTLRALRDAGLAPADVGEVLLVGGATRMPCAVRFAAQIFDRMPDRRLPPDEAVALGAAVQAALKEGHAAVDDVVVTDIAPFTLGVAVATRLGARVVSGMFAPILERGTVIPASRVQTFHTMADNQREILVEVFQGEHASCEKNRKLGQYNLRDLPPGPAGSQSVDVRFSYDLNGLLEVDMTLLATGRRETLVVEQTPGRLTAPQIAAARKALERLKFHPREALPNTTALARADSLFVELVGPSRAALGEAIAHFRAVLEGQDPRAIEEARAHLLAAVEHLGRSR
jgi:molecular chaperone HscC